MPRTLAVTRTNNSSTRRQAFNVHDAVQIAFVQIHTREKIVSYLFASRSLHLLDLFHLELVARMNGEFGEPEQHQLPRGRKVLAYAIACTHLIKKIFCKRFLPKISGELVNNLFKYIALTGHPGMGRRISADDKRMIILGFQILDLEYESTIAEFPSRASRCDQQLASRAQVLATYYSTCSSFRLLN